MRAHGYMKDSGKYPKVTFDVVNANGTDTSTPAIRIVVKTYEGNEHKAIYYLDSAASTIALIEALTEGAKFLDRSNWSKLTQLGHGLCNVAGERA